MDLDQGGQETVEQRARRLGLDTTPGDTGAVVSNPRTPAGESVEQRAARLGLSSSMSTPEERAVRLGLPRSRANQEAGVPSWARPSTGKTVATHLINMAQGVPGMEAVQAETMARARGESYREGLKRVRGLTSTIDPRLSFAEHLLGGVGLAPILPGSAIAGGAIYGAADQALSADPQSIGERVGRTALGATLGAGLGVVGEELVAPVVRGAANAVTRGIQKAAPRTAARVGSLLTRATGAAPVGDEAEARQMLASALERGGVGTGIDPVTGKPTFSPTTAAKAIPRGQPSTMMELGSENVPSLVRTARNVPTSQAAQITDRFLRERGVGTGKRIESALTDATGLKPTDTSLPVEQHAAQARARAGPLYKEADAYGQIKDPETVAEIQRLLKEPVFQEGWRRGETMARIEGSDVGGPMLPKDVEAAAEKAKANAALGAEPEAAAAPKRTQSIRDSSGRIRRDLSGVSDEDLDAEWQRLAELHGQAEGENAGVEDAGYREHYEELPRTEKRGHKGKEDLPDADGMVDPERLLADNKTVSSFRKGKMVRDAQKKLMDRIQTELSSRPSAGDFEFGASKFVPNREPLPDQPVNGPTIRQINRWKKGMDATIESKIRGASLSREEARTLRRSLNNVLARVDNEVPAFKAARDAFRGPMELKDAAELGAKHFSTSNEPGQLARQMAGMSKGERSAYTNNALNKVVQLIRRAAANPNLPIASKMTNIVQRILGGEDAAERFGMLFPDARAETRFIARMHEESKYPATNAYLRNQSTTNKQALESQTSVGELLGSTIDAVRHPFSAIGKAIDKRRTMSVGQANEIASQATATGARMDAILEAMEADVKNTDAGRTRLKRALLAPAVGAATGTESWRDQINSFRNEP